MSASPLSPDEFRAAAEAHRELGPEYADAVVESFLERVDREISDRINAHLAGIPQARNRPVGKMRTGQHRALRIGLVTGVMVTGVPLTLLAIMVRGSQAAQLSLGPWLLSVWAVIVIVCLAVTAVHRRRDRDDGRPDNSARPRSTTPRFQTRHLDA